MSVRSTEAIIIDESTKAKSGRDEDLCEHESRSRVIQTSYCSRSRSDLSSQSAAIRKSSISSSQQAVHFRGGSSYDPFQELRKLSSECSVNMPVSDRSCSSVENTFPAEMDAWEGDRECNSYDLMPKLQINASTAFCHSSNAVFSDGSSQEYGFYDRQKQVTITTHDELKPVMEELGWKPVQPAALQDHLQAYSYHQQGIADPICNTSLPAEFTKMENPESLIWFLSDIYSNLDDSRQRRLVFWSKKHGPASCLL